MVFPEVVLRVCAAMSDARLVALAGLVGADHVLTGDDCAGFATDIYFRLEMPLAVVRPGTVDELAGVVATATRSGIAVCARGGGTSYTAGYLPISRNTVIIDFGRLDRIVEINLVDAYVTVESGVTWAALKSTLDPLGLRTPFYGPFSGLRATVGGAVSQHAISLGSAAHGLSAQSVLSMLVVLADGTRLHTGSAARVEANAGMHSVGPFMRHDGPDLTGLFTGDCGAFGVKATITLALVATKAAFRGVSFSFADFTSMHLAMREISRERLDDSHFGLSMSQMRGQLQSRRGAAAVRDLARTTLRAAPTRVVGLYRLLRMALSGKHAISQAPYSTHFIVEGVDSAEVRARARRLRTIAGRHGSIAMGRAAPTRRSAWP